MVFYSRTGITRNVGLKLAELLNAEIEEIFDTANRNGLLGFLLAGKDATLKKQAKIKPLKKNPKNFDLIVIGTPVWSLSLSCPIRTFIAENQSGLKKVAFYCTRYGFGISMACNEAEKLLGKKLIAMETFKTKEVLREKQLEQHELKDFMKKIEKFAKKIKNNCK